MGRQLLVSVTLALAVACAAEPHASVRIESPADGATITSDSVRVRLSASGIEIALADGTADPERAHHHLFLDADLTPPHQPIPTGVEGIIHLGGGDSTYTLAGLANGRHRLIAVLATGNHVPLDPWAVDTAHFTVEVEPR